MLTYAGCEYGDLEKLVQTDGVESSLRHLLGEGVYVTVEEYKGRRPIVLGSLTVPSGPAALANPLADACGRNDVVKGLWTVPGGYALLWLLKLSSFGTPIER